MKTVILIVFLVASIRGFSQFSSDSIYVLPDSVKPFTIENFYAAVLQNHPIVKQTRLLSETALQEVRLARGAFDPKLEARMSQKEFADKEYYNKWTALVSIPSWFPIDPKFGIEHNSGAYIDPENSVPQSDNYRQIFTSLSLPIGKGLFTDERRAALKQSKLFVQLAEAEQIKLINKILLEAAKDYWQWYYAYYNYRFLSRSVNIASEIFRRVKLDASLGEASSIDTLQAHITLRQRQVEKQESYLEFQNSGIRVSNYLWDAEQQPLQLTLAVAPVLVPGDSEILSTKTLEELLFQARQNHPELKKLRLKLGQLDIEKKLNKEYLKPRFDVTYSFLNQPIAPSGGFQPFAIGSNYKFGLDFSIPVFLRKERAKLGQTNIKIRSTELEQSQAEREIVNQVQQVFNQLVNTNIILIQQSGMVRSYERILQAEVLNLENGESDLFKINVQQEKLILSQTKLLKLKAENEKLKATLYWAAGVRNLSVLP